MFCRRQDVIGDADVVNSEMSGGTSLEDKEFEGANGKLIDWNAIVGERGMRALKAKVRAGDDGEKESCCSSSVTSGGLTGSGGGRGRLASRRED